MRSNRLLISVKLCLILMIGFPPNLSIASPIGEPIGTCQISPQHPDFRNLQDLINRYSNAKNLPTRSMAYMEFANFVNVVLDQMNEQLAQYLHSIDRNDIETIKTLQERFWPELAILRQRTDLFEIRQACNMD